MSFFVNYKQQTEVQSQEFTATAGQTLFTLTQGDYTVGTKSLFVAISGVLQPFSAYTETSTTSFTVSEALEVGTKVFAYWYEETAILSTNEVQDARSSVLKNQTFDNLNDRLNSIEDSMMVNVKDYGVIGNGSTNDYTTLNALLTAIGSTLVEIVLPSGTYKISSDITFPANVVLNFRNGAMLSPDTGKTVTINCEIKSGFYQIFSGLGIVAGTLKNKEVYPQWFGDVTVDGTIQKAIDFCAQMLKGTVFLKYTGVNYKAVKIGLRAGVNIKSDGATLEPITSAETSFIYIAENGPIQYCQYSGFNLLGNDLNTSQNGIDLTAKPLLIPAYNGGIWYSDFSFIKIINFSAIGLKVYCDDTGSGGDMANQFLDFFKVNVYRKLSAAICLGIRGQLGQTVFRSCEFTASSTSILGYNIDLYGLDTGNDQQAYIKLDNCTIQNSEKGIKTRNVWKLILKNCWFENLKSSVLVSTTTNCYAENNHFANAGSDGSGTGYIFNIGSNCKLTDIDNRVIGTYDWYMLSSAQHYGVRTINSNYDGVKIKGTTTENAYVSGALSIVNAPVCFMSITGNVTITTINSHFGEGEHVTIRCHDTAGIYTASFTGGGNIEMPAGVTSITLSKKDTLTLIKMSLTTPIWIVVSHTGVEA